MLISNKKFFIYMNVSTHFSNKANQEAKYCPKSYYAKKREYDTPYSRK